MPPRTATLPVPGARSPLAAPLRPRHEPCTPSLAPFHLAFPVDDLARARAFYGGVLGCPEGRSSDEWIDFNLFGHQIVAHLAPPRVAADHHNPVDGHAVPVPHFGVVLPWDDFHALAARLRDQGVALCDRALHPFCRPGGRAGHDVLPGPGGQRAGVQEFPRPLPAVRALKAAVTELLFIRHGETDWNRQLRFQGQIDVPLNATGHAAGRAAGARLAGERWDALFTSDLLRARETAAPLAEAWRLQPQALAGFREQSFGVLEGLDVPTIQALHPELWRQWLEHRGDFALPGGESLRQFHQRVMAAVQALAAAAAGRRAGRRHPRRRAGHAVAQRQRGLPLAGLRTCDIPNTGLNRLRWAGGELHIDGWADAAHLEGLPPQASLAITASSAPPGR